MTENKKYNRRIIYVFQGGGALGTFQCGGVQALYENGYRANMVVGISIGSINAAIIAGNLPENRLSRLEKFWQTITVKIPFPDFGMPQLCKIHNHLAAQHALYLGQPGFFKPALLNPWFLNNSTPDKLGFYDTSPLRETLGRLIDFDYLNEGHIRLCVGATELESGDFVFFDNYEQKLTVDHIMASCALPPGFAAVKINDKYYVDGGVYANTPMSRIIDEFAKREDDIKDVLCFMFDLFSAEGVLPHTLDGMLERVKDIGYSSHAKRAGYLYATSQNLSHAIRILASHLPEEKRNDPLLQEIIKLGWAHRLDLVHVVYHSKRGTELNSKDYDFSVESAIKHWHHGYDEVKLLISENENQWNRSHAEGSTVYTLDGNKSKVFII